MARPGQAADGGVLGPEGLGLPQRVAGAGSRVPSWRQRGPGGGPRAGGERGGGARAGVLGREGPGCRVTGSPPPQNAFGLHVPFFFFATICLVNLLFTGCCVPETKGRSLEQIESFFRSGRRSFLH